MSNFNIAAKPKDQQDMVNVTLQHPGAPIKSA
ncbi:hypothetical protein AE02_04377 [Klebsiella variicola]|nr:hypothetical protein AE02_04377 [Klebsiella variicola]